VNAARVEAGHDAGAARSADWALAIRLRKSNAFADKGIDVRRANVLVPQSLDRVESLLIGAVPENVWSSHVVLRCLEELTVSIVSAE
jgi:hypothetical protein